MLMYPKQKTKKKRKRHPPSIISQEPGTCYLCVKLHGNYVQHRALHKHHVFEGKNRMISERYGLWVYLCWQHHTYGKESAHGKRQYLQLMREDLQREFERQYSREKFWELFRENFLGLEEKDGMAAEKEPDYL